MARARVTHTKERIENGKTTYQETQSVFITKEQLPFAHLLLQDIGRLYSIQGAPMNLLLKMAQHMDFNNEVRVSGKDRKDWAAEIGITHQTLNVAMSKLMETGIVFRQSLGSYIIDPELIHKGFMNDILNKAETFNANFDITYDRSNSGSKRRIKIRKPGPDPDTGEVY